MSWNQYGVYLKKLCPWSCSASKIIFELLARTNPSVIKTTCLCIRYIVLAWHVSYKLGSIVSEGFRLPSGQSVRRREAMDRQAAKMDSKFRSRKESPGSINKIREDLNRRQKKVQPVNVFLKIPPTLPQYHLTRCCNLDPILDLVKFVPAAAGLFCLDLFGPCYTAVFCKH